MDETFTQLLGRWQTFYFTLSGAAATLTGLLFVALSLHLAHITDPQRPELRLLALQTFTNFIYVVLCALAFLIPYETAWQLSAALGIISLAALMVLAVQGAEGRRVARRLGSRGAMLWRLGVPGLCYGWVGALALALSFGNAGLLFGLVPAFLVLLGAGARNAWDLMMRTGAQQREQRRAAGEGDAQLHRIEQQLREVTRRQRQITRQQEEAGRAGGLLPPRRRG
jgi:hypothetical protein